MAQMTLANCCLFSPLTLRLYMICLSYDISGYVNLNCQFSVVGVHQ